MVRHWCGSMLGKALHGSLLGQWQVWLLMHYNYNYNEQRIHSPILCLPEGLNPNLSKENWNLTIIGILGIFIALVFLIALLVSNLVLLLKIKHKGTNVCQRKIITKNFSWDIISIAGSDIGISYQTALIFNKKTRNSQSSKIPNYPTWAITSCYTQDWNMRLMKLCSIYVEN